MASSRSTAALYANLRRSPLDCCAFDKSPLSVARVVPCEPGPTLGDMGARYAKEMLTPAVIAAEERAYGRSIAVSDAPPDRLGPDEIDFIARRDSFYMASVSESGWPYIQHRGGPAGFLKAIGPDAIAFADLRGNRQLISTGNIAKDDRVALILVDYPKRARLKIIGHARALLATDDPSVSAAVTPAGMVKRVERIVRIEVVGFDWNCPAYLTPRYTIAEVDEHTAELRARIAELESELAALA